MITGHRLKGPRINIAWETEQPEPNEASIDWYKVSTLLSFSFFFVYFQLFFNAIFPHKRIGIVCVAFFKFFFFCPLRF